MSNPICGLKYTAGPFQVLEKPVLVGAEVRVGTPVMLNSGGYVIPRTTASAKRVFGVSLGSGYTTTAGGLKYVQISCDPQSEYEVEVVGGTVVAGDVGKYASLTAEVGAGIVINENRSMCLLDYSSLNATYAAAHCVKIIRLVTRPDTAGVRQKVVVRITYPQNA